MGGSIPILSLWNIPSLVVVVEWLEIKSYIKLKHLNQP